MKALESTIHVFRKQLLRGLALITVAGASAVSAQTPATGDIEVGIMGVTFLQAPPGRDKNLTAFGTFDTQEKVEVNAHLTSKSRIFVEGADSVFEQGDVKVTAFFPDKSSQSFGFANAAGFPKFSTNGKTRTINISIKRLPDRVVSGFLFVGTVPLTLAKSTKKFETAFDPNKPGAFNLGGALVSSFVHDAQKLELKGDSSLVRIKQIALKTPNGVVVNGERRGNSRMNNEYSQTWNFSVPVTKGQLQAEIYESLETINHPIKLTIGRPW